MSLLSSIVIDYTEIVEYQIPMCIGFELYYSKSSKI